MVPSNAPAKTGKFFFLYTISRKNTFFKNYFLKFFQFKFHDCQAPRGYTSPVALGKIEGGHKNQNREKIPKSVTFGGGLPIGFHGILEKPKPKGQNFF